MQTGVRLILDPLENPNSKANTIIPAVLSPHGSQIPRTEIMVRIIEMIDAL